jgi:hypothetical protein
MRGSQLDNDGTWKPISTAPFDHELEVAVIDADGVHALVFPCRRVLDGWLKAETNERLDALHPTHWRIWAGPS